MDWAIYGALLVGALATGGAAALLVVRGLRAWRDLKRFRRQLGRELERLADLGEATTQKLEKATSTAELEESLSRLRVTLARFAVLRASLDESLDAFRRLTAVYPRA
jgi:predicted nuclease with TOPRIM domain